MTFFNNVRSVRLDTQIKQWLEQRQSTLVLLHDHLAHANATKAVSFETVALFCQTLMDYVSLGHFSVYGKLLHAANNHPVSQDKTLLEKIGLTTDAVLAFNEKYSEPTHLKTLRDDLSHLAERLADRMGWEHHLMKPYLDSIGVQLSH